MAQRPRQNVERPKKKGVPQPSSKGTGKAPKNQ